MEKTISRGFYIKRFFSNAYIASILGTAAILAILKDLQVVFGDAPPLLLFLVVIAFAAWSGGLKTGLLTTVLSVAASAYFLVEPHHSFHVTKTSEIIRIAILFGVGALCSLFIARLHKQEERALQQVMEREEQLKQEIAKCGRTQADLHLYVSLIKSSNEFIGMCDTDGTFFLLTMPGCG